MELTRRDAVAALGVLGAASGGGALVVSRLQDDENTTEQPVSHARIREVFQAIAPVVYPDELDGIATFVERFLDGRLTDEDQAAGMAAAVADLEDHAESWHGDRVSELSRSTREQLLREVGADAAAEDPAGTDAERIRYFVVNELLLALYASPTGGELVGVENPIGHPGGIQSYQQGPP